MVGDLPTRPLEAHEIDRDEDEVSQITNQPQSGAATSLMAGTAPDEALRALIDNGGGEDSTVIRPTGPPPGANPFGEAHTLIKAPATAAAETVKLPTDPARDTSTNVLLRQPDGAPGRAFPRTPTRRKPVRVPLEVHSAWMLVAFAGAVAAFVLGLLIGSRLPHAAAPLPTPESSR